MYQDEELIKLRQLIDVIDEKMAVLFNERLTIIKKIAKIKKENNIPIENKSREQDILNRNSNFIKEEYLFYYQQLLNKILDISKELQSKLYQE